MKAQVGLEYMLIMGISLALLVPLFILVNTYTSTTKTDLNISNLEDSLDNLAEASDLVYSQGPPAKITVEVYIPEGVLYTNVTDHMFVVRLRFKGESTDVVTRTSAPVSGSLPTAQGSYKISLNAEKGFVNVTY
jgi:hypothetical protein